MTTDDLKYEYEREQQYAKEFAEKLKQVPLEDILSKVNFKELKVQLDGNWGIGKRYILVTHSKGSSWPCENFDQLRYWIALKLRHQISDLIKELK